VTPHRQPCTPAAHIALPPPQRPVLTEQPSKFILLEREAEEEYRGLILASLQGKVEAVAEVVESQPPRCVHCQLPMGHQDRRTVGWLARCGRLRVQVNRYRCRRCRAERRPLLEELGVEPGRICGALARLLAVLAVVAPYELAARLADVLLGVKISAMGVWRVTQRLGQAAYHHSEALSLYHSDSRSQAVPSSSAPTTVVLAVDGCSLGMQVRKQRRRRSGSEFSLPPLPPVEEGQFREVKTGVVLLPEERTESSPGRHALVRRWLVSCLGHADAIYAQLWAKLREVGWLGAATVVVIVGDGAEWIWKRATFFPRRCEILDFWHAVEHAWQFAQSHYGENSARAANWVHAVASALRKGQVQAVLTRLKKMRPHTPETQQQWQALIRYYTENASRMRYDEYLRLGYGIGSGAVESAHKQLVHARMRQAGMRWSEAGARRLLALRLLLLNQDWTCLDRLPMQTIA
jgi:hypothetical protein